MIDEPIMKENDLYHVTWGWKGSKYQQLKTKGFALLCYLIYHSNHYKTSTSAGVLMNQLKIHRTFEIQKYLADMKHSHFIDSTEELWLIKKNQLVDITIKKFKAQCIIDLLKQIPYDTFQSLIKLGYKHWAVYCYLYQKQKNKHFICTGHEMQEALYINRNTINNIIIDLELDGLVEVKRQSGSTKEGFGRFVPNLYRVL